MLRSVLVLCLTLALCAMPLIGASQPSSSSTSGSTPGQRANGKTPLQSLVTAEQEFAALSASKGIRTSFLANLSQDAVLFRPMPVNGYKVWSDRPESKARLLWEPAYAEIAGSGDFGITSGPWELHPPAGGQAEVGYGQFFTVWTRAGKSPWKVAIDIGVSHPKPATGGLKASTMVFGPDHAPSTAAPEESTPALIQTIDGSFSRTIGGLGPSAIANYLTADARYLREGSFPLVGAAAADSLTAGVKHTAWRQTGAGIARSGDMGYVYGIREDSTGVSWQTPDSTSYLHVWRKNDKKAWKLAVVVENPVKRGQR